jgi:outer membrane autotransporter protein
VTGGTQILSGANTYTGVTTISAGTLQIGNGGATGSVTGNIVDNAALVFNRTGTLTYGGVISGTGSLAKIGTSTLTLTGNNTYAGGSTINAGTLAVSSDANLGAASGGLTFGGGTVQSTATFTSNRGVTLNAGGGTFSTNAATTLTLGGVISGVGGLTKSGGGTLTLTATNTYQGNTTITAGTLAVSSDVNLGSATGILNLRGGGTLQFLANFTSNRNVTIGPGNAIFDTNGHDATLTGAITGGSSTTEFHKIGTGTLTLTGNNAYTGQLQILAGTLTLTGDNQPSITPTPISSGATLQIGNGGGTGSLTGNVTNSGLFIVNRSNAYTFDGVISGAGSFVQMGPGTTTLTATNTYSGGTTINAGTLAVSADANLGNTSGGLSFGGGTLQYLAGFTSNRGVTLNAGGGTFDTNGKDATLSGTIGGTGGLAKIGVGTLTLSGASTYSGATAVNAGTLMVSGSIANSAVTVNSGATLAGTGTVGATTINGGGTFAPGPVGTPGTMTVQGNLAFQSGALYLVQVNPSTASSANAVVGGTATLAGTVQAVFASGSYAARTYTILSAAGGLGGTTFNTLTTSNLPAGFTPSLSYTATNVILNLTATLSPGGGPGAGANPQNVASALNNFFNKGGTLPAAFVSVFGLTGGDLSNALSQHSGEAATGGQQVAFQLTNQFLGLMLDPFVDGRSGVAGAGGPAIGFAPEHETLPEDIALAYSSVLKAPAMKAPTFEQRWTAWGGAYGGSNRTSGDLAVLGSHDLSARAAGFAGGLDYHLSRESVVGFALAGGGTDWSLAQGLGGGRSDAFQVGVYGATRAGPAYLAAALAYTNHWMSTDRFAFAGDHLTASFNAQSLGARVESGYRFATVYGGLTPYAAIQAQSFHMPGYRETDLNGGDFALAYNARTGTDTRSEVGGRFDRVLALYTNAVLSLRARLAWAHDWVSDPTLAAAFQTLPGASFIVNGAAPAKNSALASAGAELRLANGVTLLGKFDGEFASRSSTYAGTGTVRYAW